MVSKNQNMKHELFKAGDRVDVYREDELWCPNVLVLWCKDGKVTFFHQGQDENVTVDVKRCKRNTTGYAQPI
jgi:hypothetical protein